MARVREDRMSRVRVRAGQRARTGGLGFLVGRMMVYCSFCIQQDRIGLLILFPKKLDFINFPFHLLITLYIWTWYLYNFIFLIFIHSTVSLTFPLSSNVITNLLKVWHFPLDKAKVALSLSLSLSLSQICHVCSYFLFCLLVLHIIPLYL